jgi:hypothetical protein
MSYAGIVTARSGSTCSGEVAMGIQDRLEYLRTEDQRLLELAEKIENALDRISKPEFTDRLGGLLQLRELDHSLAGIVEHCHSEERIIESTYHHFLDPPDYDRIKKEHEQLLRLVGAFRVELRFATADLTNGVSPAGEELAEYVRVHVTYEQKLLGKIASLEVRN